MRTLVDYEDNDVEPPVVLWKSEKANQEFFKFDEDEIDEPNHYKFTKPVAKNFSALLDLID